MPELPGSLVGKVMDAAVDIDTHSPEDLTNGLERLLGVELAPDEVEYLEDLGRRVLRAVLETRLR
jgi:D-Tyr-tRNAtyr deacylase